MRILISAYTGLGNFILNTPMINRLKELYPNSKIDLICNLEFGVDEVLKYSNIINKVYKLSTTSSFLKKLKYFNYLKKKKYDFIFLPFSSTPSFLLYSINFFSPKSKIIAHFNIYNFKGLNKFKRLLTLVLLTNIKWVPMLHGRHEIDLYLDLIDVISYKNHSLQRDYKTLVTFDQYIKVHELPNNYIVFQPSARNGMSSPKTWPLNNYFILAKEWLKKHPDYQVVLVGDKGDQINLSNHPITKLKGVVNLIGKTSLSQLCKILKGSSAVLVNDSGVMHVADALNVPLIALYGPTDYTRTRPLSTSSKILFSYNACYCMCYAFENSEDFLLKKFGNNYCMKNILPSQVFSSLEKLVMG